MPEAIIRIMHTTRRLSWQDGLFVVLALIIFGSVSQLLYASFAREVGAVENIKPIGIVSFKHNTVKRKLNKALFWNQVGNNVPVYSRDSISTGEEAGAIIKLNDGSQIDIADNTLVILDFEDIGGKKRFKIQQGSIQIYDKQERESEIISKGKTYKVKGAKLRIVHNNETEEVSISAYRKIVLLTTSDGKKFTIKPAEITNLNLEKGVVKIEKPTFTLGYPHENAFIFSDQSQPSVKFLWKALRKPSRQSKNTIEVSLRGDFSRIYTSQTFSSNSRSQSMALETGIWHWRIVERRGKKRIVTASNKFTIVSRGTIRSYRPLENEEFNQLDASTPKTVNFAWSTNSNASSYLLEIARDKQFKNIFRKKILSGTNYKSGFTAGTYYWRVSARHPSLKESLTTRIRRFEVLLRPVKKRKIEINIFNPPDNEVIEYEKGTKSQLFNWEQNALPKGYKYEILMSANEKVKGSMVLRKRTILNYYSLKKRLGSASYYWRVNVLDSKNKVVSSSRIHSFLYKGGETVAAIIAGEDASGVSSDEVSDKLKELEKIQNLAKGQEDKKKEAEKNKNLELAKDVEIGLFRPINKSRQNSYTLQTKGIRFRWKKLQGVTVGNYTLLIARDKKFKKIVYQKKVGAKNTYRIRSSSIAKKGNYYWKVEGIGTREALNKETKEKESGSLLITSKPYSFKMLKFKRYELEGIGVVWGLITKRDNQILTILTVDGLLEFPLDLLIE